MKPILTIEQSQHLIELGVDYHKASFYSDSDINNYPLKEPLFTLVDLLELLPKEIHDKEMYEDYYLSIETDYQSTWLAAYRSYIGGEIAMEEGSCVAPELIDALYELLCWVIESGYFNQA